MGSSSVLLLGCFERFCEFGCGARHIAQDSPLFFGDVKRFLEIRAELLQAGNLLLMRQVRRLAELVLHGHRGLAIYRAPACVGFIADVVCTHIRCRNGSGWAACLVKHGGVRQ